MPQGTKVMTRTWITMFVTPFVQDTSQVIAEIMMTKTNKIGVVGSHPIPEIIRNINCWGLLTLEQSVNPDIEVEIVWINSWFDPPKDMDRFFEQGNDILFTTTDSPSVVTRKN